MPNISNKSQVYFCELIIVKKLIILVSDICIEISFMGCTKEPSTQIPIEKTNIVNVTIQNTEEFNKSFDVSIQTDMDTYEIHTTSVCGITLTTKLEGSTDKDIEYYWTIDSDKEIFDTASGPQK